MKSKIVVMLLAAGFMPSVFADNICKEVDANGLETFIDCANAAKGAEPVKLEKPNIANMPKAPEISTVPSAPVQNEKPKTPPKEADEIVPLEGNNVYIEGGSRNNVHRRPIPTPLPATPLPARPRPRPAVR